MHILFWGKYCKNAATKGFQRTKSYNKTDFFFEKPKRSLCPSLTHSAVSLSLGTVICPTALA